MLDSSDAGIYPGRRGDLRVGPVCGRELEPLRAGEVILLEDGFRFLCNSDCRRRYYLGERLHDERRALPRTPSRSRPAVKPPKRIRRMRDAETSAAHAALSAPLPSPPWIGLGASALGIVLGGFATYPLVAALALVAVGVAAVTAWASSWPARREIGWLGWALGPSGALVAGLAALVAQGHPAGRWWMAGAALAAGATVLRAWLDARSNVPLAQTIHALASRMPAAVRAPVGSDWSVEVDAAEVDAARVRTGQQILVGEGETIGVDGVVQAGEAEVLPHPSARTPMRRTAGDPVLAGARVVDGELRVLATRVGADRALLRPSGFGDPGSSRSASLTRNAARVARWGALLALAGAAVSLLVADTGAGLAGQLTAVAAVLLAAPLAAIRRASEAPYVAAAATAADRGIAFQSARALDRAGRIAIVGLCAHGTVTEGEPEIVEVHAIGDVELGPLMALVAGAQSAAEGHPIARAIRRYAMQRNLSPVPVRRATAMAGRGVTAITPSGQTLVVGSRQLLLAEGVSVAVADADAARAEARGHTVVFVGVEGRVRAVISMRDEERPGARAAVQRLNDLGVEVLLLSGDHRATIEALARPLDIGHVKAELLPDEQGAEVRRLRETGGLVAVIGRAGHDEPCLTAADVPVVLGAAGAPEERAVALTGEDVRDAAAALWLARAARRAAVRATTIAMAAGGLAMLLAASGYAAPAVAALLGLAIDGYALPTASRLLRRIELRLPARG